jgi:hypothetical protein
MTRDAIYKAVREGAAFIGSALLVAAFLMAVVVAGAALAKWATFIIDWMGL